MTFNEGLDHYPHWTPDGEQIVFSSGRDSGGFYVKAADGTGVAAMLTQGVIAPAVNAITPDGRLTIGRIVGQLRDLTTIPLDGEGAIETLLGSEYNELNADISPDGAWMAFQSDESGQAEVYVRPFPDVEGGRWQVSTAGGMDPVWSSDGSELFYRQGRRLMAASVSTDAGFSRATPVMLFEGDYFFGSAGRNYDVGPDGRFLMVTAGDSGDETTSPQINVVLNWHEELKARVPVP